MVRRHLVFLADLPKANSGRASVFAVRAAILDSGHRRLYGRSLRFPGLSGIICPLVSVRRFLPCFPRPWNQKPPGGLALRRRSRENFASVSDSALPAYALHLFAGLAGYPVSIYHHAEPVDGFSLGSALHGNCGSISFWRRLNGLSGHGKGRSQPRNLSPWRKRLVWLLEQPVLRRGHVD